MPLTIFCLVSELAASLLVGHSRCRWSSLHPRCMQNGNWKRHGLEHLSISLLKRRKAWGLTECISRRIIGFMSILSHFQAGGEEKAKILADPYLSLLYPQSTSPRPRTLWPTCPIHSLHSTRRKKSFEGHLTTTQFII